MSKFQVDEYVDQFISLAPVEIQPALISIRSIIREVAPDAQERSDYFHLPGYSYPGYDYDGMFVWFSYKKANVRLHVRPPVLENFKDKTSGFKQTKSIIDFSGTSELPQELIRSLIKSSLQTMKDKKESTN